METQKKYIVAVEFGSTHITAAAGHRESDNRFVVDAVEVKECKDSIKRGRIINVSDVSVKLSQIVRQLEVRISPSKISQIYVGVGGQSVRSIDYPVVRSISSEEPISQALLDNLEMEARNRVLENGLVVLDVVPGECRVDNRITDAPRGQYGSEIRVSYRLIVGNELNKRNIQRVFEEVKIPVAGYICTANAAAYAVLTEEERRQGCVLIDFGAETTTLSVYKEGSLVYMITIPLGGNNITRDICSLHVKESEAEAIKKSYLPNRKEGEVVDWGMDDYYLNLKPEQIEDVILSRQGEIIANVKAQIEDAKLRPLSAGITMIGGASALQGLGKVLAEETKLDVSRGSVMGVALTAGINGAASVQVIGLLLKGDKVCAAPPVKEPAIAEPEPISENDERRKDSPKTGEHTGKPQGKPGGFMENMGNLFGKLMDEVNKGN